MITGRWSRPLCHAVNLGGRTERSNQRDMLNPDKQLWFRLMDLGTREIGITCRIAARLDNRASLRAATKASRQLLNTCVACVKLRGGSDYPTTELADTFPNADGLEILGSVFLVVGYLTSASPRFLGKLRTLCITAEGADEACQELLCRCGTHTVLHVLQAHAAIMLRRLERRPLSRNLVPAYHSPTEVP
jgi:hypothetical protein